MTTQADFAELLQKSQQLNLKYKTKIIELENDLNHERSKARQYQSRFKDAILQSQFSEGQGLMQKLNSKQKQLIDCRKQIIDLNRRINNTANSPTQNDLIALARENQELMANIEEIKSAAIAAIMAKEEQIEQLSKNMDKYQLMENQLKFQYEKYESLENEFEIAMNEKGQEIKELTQKISREREMFLVKLQAIQKEANQQQNFKESLLEKANDLEGTIEKSEMLIADYQNKIYELQNQISHQKVSNQQDKARIQIQIEELRQEIKNFEREQKNSNKILEQLKNKERTAQDNIQRLNQKIQQLNHKLTIKKKKDNKVIKDKITSSFAGVSKNNPVYASFAFRPKDSIVEDQDNHKHLGDYPELQEVDGLIENFNFQDFGQVRNEEVQNEIPISQMMSKKKKVQIAKVQKNQNNKPQIPKPQPTQNVTNNNAPAANQQLLKQIENNKQAYFRLQTQKKELQSSLNDAYNQMDQLNLNINSLTNELQQQRKNIAELRQQMKKTKKEAELLVEVQSLNLHVEKLEMDMITSKLKNAEELQFAREKYQREKVMWTQKLVKMTEQLAKQDLQIAPKVEEKKKKKGFFG